MQQRLIINHRFVGRTHRHDFVLAPVITPRGDIKHLKIRTSPQPSAWLLFDWEYEGPRPVLLKSVTLKTDLEEKGAKFLELAYKEEGNEEGWEEYQRYLDAIYYRETSEGMKVAKNRPDAKLHFPEDLLPKYVKEVKARHQGKKEQTQWVPKRKPKGK